MYYSTTSDVRWANRAMGWALQMRARREAAVALEGEMKRNREQGWQDGKQAGRKAGAQGAGRTCGAFDEL